MKTKQTDCTCERHWELNFDILRLTGTSDKSICQFTLLVLLGALILVLCCAHSTDNYPLDIAAVMASGDEVSEEVMLQRVQVSQMLSSIGQQLDKRYRKMTQLGAISRDITWESKRAISQVLGYFQNPSALNNAERTLNHVRTSQKCFKGLAASLLNEDMYLLGRYYTSGIQEFIEAMALINFFKHGTILTYEDVVQALTIEISVPKESEDASEQKERENETVSFAIRLSKREFYMGLQDMTGELVRACANVVYTPDFKTFLLKSLAVVRALYQCTSILCPMGKEMQDKSHVMRQSMIKLEIACFDCVVGRKMNHLFFSKPVKINTDDRDNEPDDSGYD